MPLKGGKSKEAFTSNMEELMRAYKEKGMIGKSKPGSSAKARKQALAIAFSKQKEG